MKPITTTLTRLLLGGALLFSTTALAEQMVADDRYEIHYNAFNSSFLTPEVAQLNGITRSKYRALVNVSVLKRGEAGSKTPVTAHRQRKSGQPAGSGPIDRVQTDRRGRCALLHRQLPLYRGGAAQDQSGCAAGPQ